MNDAWKPRSSWRLDKLGAADAVCLDGSPAVMYRHAHSGSENASRWHIFLEGGGWCFSQADCIGRQLSLYGSSRGHTPTAHTPTTQCRGLFGAGGLFAGYRQAVLKYCDGASFAGTRGVAVGPSGSFQGRPLAPTHAGAAILDAAVQQLLAGGLANATDVVVTGCSAGGLAALLAAERVRALVRAAGAPLRRFKVIAFSGLFFPQLGGSALSPFAEQMLAMARMSRLRLPPRCAAGSRRWTLPLVTQCLLGAGPLDALPDDLPAFVEQSTVDRWQLTCVLSAGAGAFQTTNCTATEVGLSSCVRHFRPVSPTHATPPGCSRAQTDRLRAWHETTVDALLASPALKRPGTAAFVHHCATHCVARPENWRLRSIDGVSLREAVRSWWDAAADAPPSARVDRCRPRWAQPAAQPSCLPSCGRVGSGGGDDRPALLERGAQVMAALRAAGWGEERRAT